MRRRGVIIVGKHELPCEDVQYVENADHARELFGSDFCLPRYAPSCSLWVVIPDERKAKR